MAASAADVPGKYDVVFENVPKTGGGTFSFGCVLSDTVEPSLPFRTHRAIYDITQTFVERSNVGAAYSDNQQDFFLTESQKDWTLGEGQRFFRIADADSVRKVWRLDNIDISIDGQATLCQAVGSDPVAGVTTIASAEITDGTIFATDATTLYEIGLGAFGNSGAHGLGATPTTVANDGKYAYVSSTAGGSVGVRKGRFSTGMSTFSATPSDVLCFHNNQLYGISNTLGVLRVYSSGGVASTVYPWVRADGSANDRCLFVGMHSWGGKLMIVGFNQLWMYDGVGVQEVAVFPRNFIPGVISGPKTMAVVDGILLIGGVEYRQTGVRYQVVYAYTDGTITKLWRSNVPVVNTPGTQIASYDGGAVWYDLGSQRVLYWDPATGAITSLFSCATTTALLAADYTQLIMAASSTLSYGAGGTKASQGVVYTSLFDFDNSLTKVFRGIKVDFTPATDGNGGSVDVAYQLDSLDGAYTTLQTGAASGTEYALSGVTGHAIGVKITINKGTSTNGPILKRVYVRAAPVLQQFRSGLYIFDCTGTAAVPRELRDGTEAPDTGYTTVQNLLQAAKSTTPFTITDKVNGTYTGLIDLQDSEGWDVYEEHPAPEDVKHPGSYLVRVKVREV